jgi:photosystem II stability/assembly factor-like uncharacterized protein
MLPNRKQPSFAMRGLAALAILFAPVMLLAGTNRWTNIGPDAGNVFALVIDPQNPSSLYASTYQGLFKSTDAGASWIAVNSPLGLVTSSLSVAIDPQNSSTIYAGFPGQRVFKSTDGGASWSAPSGDMDDYFTWQALPGSLVIDPQEPATLYAAMHHGVFKSTDGGASWHAATSGLPLGLEDVRMLAVDPQNPGTVYAACAGDFNGGAYVGGGVYKSTDGGITWRAVNSGLPPQNLEAKSLALDPKNPDTIYAWTNSGMFKSTDGGASWSAANAGLPAVFGLVSLAIDPQDTSAVYAALQTCCSGAGIGGVFKSTDGGASWVSAGLEDSVSVVAIDPQDSSTVYAASASGLGIRKSTDGAASWGLANLGLRGTWVRALSVDPQDTSKLYAATSIGIFKTTNSGASWSEANSGLPAHPASLAIDPQNSGTLYVGIIGRGIFKSTDGAANWSYAGLGGISTDFDQSLAVDPQNSGTVYAAGFTASTAPTATTALFKTTDGGATWASKGPSAISLVAIGPQDPATVYGVDIWDGRTIFRSRDGGETWSTLATPPGFAVRAEEAPDFSILVVDPQNSQTIYAGGLFTGLIKSTDGGESWNVVNLGLPDGSGIDALAIDPQNSSTVYAAGPGLGRSRLLKSTDGAVTWTDVSAGLDTPRANIESLTLDPRNPKSLFADTGDGVFAITFVP